MDGWLKKAPLAAVSDKEMGEGGNAEKGILFFFSGSEERNMPSLLEKFQGGKG